jgi:phosphoribosylformylglycinamidine synthase
MFHTHLFGGNAISAFRASRILEQLGAKAPANSGGNASLSADYFYLIESDHALGEDETRRFCALLGEPGSEVSTKAAAVKGEHLFVTPRVGTVSPWASKALDIVKNCGFKGITRLERGVAYASNRKEGFDDA